MKEKLLSMLYEQSSRGEYLSGEAAAAALHVSRNAVWKAIEGLRENGCPMEAVSRRGYRLKGEVPFLSSAAINAHLMEQYPIIVFDETDSTNRQLMRLADDGAQEGTIVIAETQSQGRGRLGRQFVSPAGSGIYMSLLLRPRTSASQSTRITTTAAVAVADAIDELTGETTAIKWVNDIYMREKKVCGILTEGSVDVETGAMRYAVLGIGINVSPPENGFPSELSGIAGWVLEKHVPEMRNLLAARVIGNFFREYNRWNDCDFVQNEKEQEDSCYLRYRKRMFLIGKPVTIRRLGSDMTECGTCIDLDPEYHLIVRIDGTGERRVLSSGEVSVRELAAQATEREMK